MTAEFLEPSDDDYTALAKRWLSISNLVKEEYGYELNQSIGDLEYLQKVIVDDLIDAQNLYATECLGVAFGRVLVANESGMDWWVAVDDFGRGIVIRYKDTTLQLAAIEMIGKRLRDGVYVDVHALYDWLMKKVNEVKDEAD